MSTPEVTLMTRQVVLDVMVPKTVTIVGTGGIGFWVAFNVAMLGCEKIILFDPDTLENHNRNRLPMTEAEVGQPKVVITKNHIRAVRPDCMVLDLAMPVNKFNIDQLEGFVFICTDTISSQKIIREHCVKNKIPFVRIGYDGRHFTIENMDKMDGVWDSLEEGADDAGRYTVVPSYALTPQYAALTAIMFCDMNVWRGFPQKKPVINVSGNIFHVGQAILEGKIFDKPLMYDDRNLQGPQIMSTDGRRVRT